MLCTTKPIHEKNSLKKNSKSFAYTLANYSSIDEENLKLIECNYHTIGREIAPSTGLPHLQGFITFDLAKTWNCAKSILSNATNNTIHVELCKKSDWVNDQYCKKTGDYWCSNSQKQGQRTDLIPLVTAIQQDKSLDQMFTALPVLTFRHFDRIIKFKQIMAKPRNWPMELWIVLGKPGIGKSRIIHHLFPDAYKMPYQTNMINPFYENYCGQETVVFDEFNNSLGYQHMLQLCDRYPMIVNIKGGHTQMRAKRIILISNMPAEDFYPDERFRAAFCRRITHVITEKDVVYISSHAEWDDLIKTNVFIEHYIKHCLLDPVMLFPLVDDEYRSSLSNTRQTTSDLDFF